MILAMNADVSCCFHFLFTPLQSLVAVCSFSVPLYSLFLFSFFSFSVLKINTTCAEAIYRLARSSTPRVTNCFAML